MHYQKKRSREVAMRGRRCMQKRVEESKNMASDNRESDNEDIQQSSSAQDDLRKDSRTNSMDIVLKRRAGIRFTN